MHVLCAMQLRGQAGDMQIKDARLAGLFNMGGAGVANYVSILEALPSKTIILGVIGLGDPEIETPETVAARIRKALDVVPAERIVVAPDCGMKYLSREMAFGKLSAMVDGAAIVRAELDEK